MILVHQTETFTSYTPVTMEKNYTEMNSEEQLQMQNLMIYHYTEISLLEHLSDEEIRDHMLFDLEVFEADERYEECALIRDVLKKWDRMND